MSNLDIWLCRVLLHPLYQVPMKSQDLRPEKHQLVMAKIVNGELGQLQDGTIVEPVTSHATESDANEARERALRDSPRDDFRVVVTMQVST